MKTFQLNSEIWLPATIETVFEFFSDARNLETLTPPWLNFKVLTPSPIEMKPGTLIDYRLRTRGIPLRWQSEITDWAPPHRFVDEQRKGPYQRWHHTHTFVEVNGGTAVGDHVDYAVPGGALVHALLVKRDIEKIFAYRQQKLIDIFKATETQQETFLETTKV